MFLPTGCLPRTAPDLDAIIRVICEYIHRGLSVEESEITRLEQQLSVAEETGDRSEECNALRNLVVCLYQLGQFSQIVGYRQKWLSVAREIQNSWQEATAQWYLGYSYKALEMQPEAIEALSQAYRLFRKMGNQEHSEQAWTWLNQLGDSYLAEREYGKAQELYQNQREILQEFNDQKVLGSVLQNLGKAQYYQGKYQSAIESHTLMLEIARYVEDRGMESLALAWLGCDRWEAGQLDFALHYFKQRLALTKTLNDTAAQRETLGWLVNLCKKLGGDGVLPCFYMAEQIELFRQLDDKDSERSTLYELGNWNFDLKQYPEAIKSFLSAIAVAEDKHIEKANAHYMLAHCYRNLEQVEAIEHYQTAIELYFEQNSHKEWAAKALDYLSAIYRGLNDYEKAIDQQQKRLELVAELGDRLSEINALWTLGCLFHDDIQQYTEAIDCFFSYLTLANHLEQEGDRKHRVASSHYMLGSSYEKLDQIDEAINHYHQATILYAENGNEEWTENSRLLLQKLEQKKQEEQQSWKSWGDTLYDLGRYEEAIATYEKLPQPHLEPNYVLAWQALGAHQLNTGDYNAALTSFKRVTELDCTHSSVWINQGITLHKLNRDEEAISCFDFAIELDSNNHNAWCNRATALMNLARYPEALDSSKKALNLNSNCPKGWNTHGAILANGFKLYREAMDAFNRVLSINPSDETALKNRNIVLSNLGFSQEELNETDNSLNLDFNNLHDWKNLGSLRRSQGRDADALIAYEQALVLDANDAELWREKGSILWDLERCQDALESWNKAIEENPSDSQTYLTFGNALLTKELNENAIYYFNQALFCYQNSLAWLGMCKALSNLGYYEAAIQNYSEAKQNLTLKYLKAVVVTEQYNKEYGILDYGEGLAHATEARKQEIPIDYWQKSHTCFQEALERFNESNLQEWYLRVLQELLSVCRELGKTKEAKYRLYEGVDLLEQLVEEASCKQKKDLLSKEFYRLKQWDTDEFIEYRTLFTELLDGVDEGWEQPQVLEHLGEHINDSYFIRWLNEFGRQQLQGWSTPDFDQGYLMIQLEEIGCRELGEVAKKYGRQIIESTIKEAEERIDQTYQKYQIYNYKEALDEYYYSNNKWSFDYRIVESCRKPYQEKLQHLEEGLVSRYADTPAQADDYLGWFNLGEELRKLEYDKAAIIAFHRTLRLTKGQFWEAWASWGYIALKTGVAGGDPSRIADIGLKFLRRNAPFYQDASGILQEIKGDYYQEGRGILYEIKGDDCYRYEHIKGPSRGIIPLINIGSLPHYELWRGWWEGAYKAYRKALDCFTTPRLRERRLGVLQKLVKICRCLGKKDEVQHFEQEGSDLLGCLLQEMPLETTRLARKFAAFDQYRVDSLAESEKVWQALKFAEWRKNICLHWLASNQWSNDKPDLDEPAIVDFSTKVASLLDSQTAIIYWHISPAAITIFVLKYKNIPKVYVLKNKEIYEAFTNPKPTQLPWGSEIVTFPTPTVTEEDFIKGTSGVYDNQLVRFEYWMEEWKKTYRDYRSGKKKEPDETLLEAEDKNPTPASHPWREKMLEELDKLAEIFHIKEITDEYLTDIKKLILIPHRDLHLLPLEYLFRDKGFTISRLPSIDLGLNLERLRATPTLPPLSIEHPDVGSTLRFAKIESIFLAHLYQIPQENRIANKDATKKRILEVIRVPADILHFTGHGEHDTDCPAESALILANGEKLTLRDLLNLPLREYYLVCLSACETGLTSTNNLIDEFVGLVSGFLARKTAYVLSTLWRVDELSTALLVIDFYRRFQAGVHPAQALGEAQQWLCTLTYPKLAEEYATLARQIKGCSRRFAEYLKSEAHSIRQNTDKMESSQSPFADPYYWAGFTITGLVK